MVDLFPDPSANPRMRDHLMISYSHQDRALVEKLAADLRERGLTVWIDFKGIQGGDDWRQSIVDGVSASALVLFIVSPDSVRSEYVKIEIEIARSAGRLIIPIMLRPLNEDADKQRYNGELGFESIQYIDFHAKGYEAGLAELLANDKMPKASVGVPIHCRKIAADLASRDWGLDNYIQEEARLLPIDASPYEDEVLGSTRENLLGILRTGERILLLGEPGIGKTVALERLAWELATLDPPILPIILKLRDYDGAPLMEWVRLILQHGGDIKALDTPEQASRFLKDMPYKGYFLLDGLNEVRPTHREKLIDEINRMAIAFPVSRFQLVVTSRVQDESWRELRQREAVRKTFVVQPITPAAAQVYLKAHLGAADGDALWARLDQRMRELAATPLLLWLIKEAWRDKRGDIPGNRGALYANFIRRMLEREVAGRPTTSIPKGTRLAAAEQLALAMHNESALTVPRKRAVELCGDAAVLDALRANGLLSGEEEYRFAPHQTVQEHFAARALKAAVLEEAYAKGVRRFSQAFIGRGPLDYAKDPWWAETFIQLAGLTDDPNTLAQAVARINPWLAYWCVEEGNQVSETTRREIERRSTALVKSVNIQDRRSAAQALAQVKSQRVIPPLAQLSIDSDASVAIPSLRALIQFGDVGEQMLEERLLTLGIQDRAAWGRLIHDNDPRPGVGLRLDGIPDIVWCTVPAGDYQLGSDEVSANPRHTASLEAFRIAKYPITYKQFQAFIDDRENGYSNAKWWDNLHEEGTAQQKDGPSEQGYKYWNHPRVSVSWYEAMAFCKWLSVKLGSEIRLPRGDEWEAAARGTDERRYPYRPEFDATKGNTRRTGIGQTSAVGIFPDRVAPCGALDMRGSVFEWMLDEYRVPSRANLGSIAVRGLRGGSWSYASDYARAAARVYNPPGVWLSLSIGFRVVLVGVSPFSK